MEQPASHASPRETAPHPHSSRTDIARSYGPSLLRLAITAPAAFLLGFSFWQIALHFDVYILMRDIGPRYILTAMAIGAGLVVLAGPRNRSIFPLWPVLFYLGERIFELRYLHPYPLAQIESGLISAITIAVVIGSIIPALHYDSVSQASRLQRRVNDLRPKRIPIRRKDPHSENQAPTPDKPPSRNSPDR